MINDIAAAAKVGTPLNIIYIADSKVISQRSIKIIAYNEKYVRAFCYHKQCYRTFKISNILAVQSERHLERGYVS